MSSVSTAAVASPQIKYIHQTQNKPLGFGAVVAQIPLCQTGASPHDLPFIFAFANSSTTTATPPPPLAFVATLGVLCCVLQLPFIYIVSVPARYETVCRFTIFRYHSPSFLAAVRYNTVSTPNK